MPPKKNSKKETVSWTFEGKEVTSIEQMPKDVYGFVYQITIEHNGQPFYYIGQKKLISRRKKKMTTKQISELPNKRSKKWYWEEKEMDWQNYCGSNKPLLTLIKEHGAKKLKLHKEILIYCFSELELKYREATNIICSGAMESDCYFNDGVSIRQYHKLKF